MNFTSENRAFYFPILDKVSYLNTAQNGLIPSHVQEWRMSYLHDQFQSPHTFRSDIIEELSGVRNGLATHFGTDVENIALIPNFSIGANAIFESMPKGQNVLILQRDYPSLTLPVRTRDFKVTELPYIQISEAGIADAIRKHQINVLAVSMTQWLDGFFLSSTFFNKLKEEFPDLIIVADGTQTLGTLPFDFTNSGIDILISSAYKWLSAGYGCGFIFVAPHMIDQLNIKYLGNNTMMTRQLTGVNHNMQQFEPGHIDYLPFGTLQRSIDFMASIGFEEIQKRISKVSLHLKHSLVQLGYLAPQSLVGGIHRNIVHFLGSESLVKFLAAHGVYVSYREGVRISIHYFNTEADVNRLIAAIKVFR